jgi:hypothetical protein
MTQQEIQDRNKEIALMLNYMHNIRFDKDWNWLMEVKEAIYRYNLDDLVFNEFKKQDKYTFNEFKDIFILGFKAYQELVKDKLFTIEDIDNAYIQGKNDESISGNKKKMREEYLQSLLPKTEWDVEFDEQGKLKLV